MSQLPQITFTGGLVDMPELRFTPSGKAVVNMRLAGKKSVRGQNGEWTDGDPIYLGVVAWEGMAENIAETCTRKGMRVTVVGRLEQNWYEAKDGSKQSRFQIVADDVAVSLRFSAFEERPQTKTDGGGKAAAADDPWGSAPPDEPPF